MVTRPDPIDVQRVTKFLCRRRSRHADLRDAARVLCDFDERDPEKFAKAIAAAVLGIWNRGASDMTTRRACGRLTWWLLECVILPGQGESENVR